MAFINGFQMQVTIPYFTAIPEDVCTNVWSWQFTTLNPSSSDWTALRALLTTFYNAVYVGGASGLQMANYAVPSLTRFRGYDMTEPTPRVPKHDTINNMSGVSLVATVIPPEEAVVLSFQGALVSGQPQARRRGRIFLGCIGSAQDSSGVSSFPILNATKRGTIAAAASALKTNAAAAGWTWSVFSRVDQAFVTVNNGWVDNAVDTQRRRGNAPNLRTTFT